MTVAQILAIISFLLVAGSVACAVGYVKVSRKEAAAKLEEAFKKEKARREQMENRPIREYQAPSSKPLEYRSYFTYAPVSSTQKPKPITKPAIKPRVEDLRRSEDYSVPAVFETATWSHPSSSYSDSSNCDTGSSYDSGSTSSLYDSGSSSSYDSGSSGSCDTGSS